MNPRSMQSRNSHLDWLRSGTNQLIRITKARSGMENRVSGDAATKSQTAVSHCPRAAVQKCHPTVAHDLANHGKSISEQMR
jgi:hypothetical protein